jgi:2'-5' RNA ligase
MGEQPDESVLSHCFLYKPMIAIDIVLLPDKAMTDFSMDANTELVKKYKSEIVLNGKNCLPHISLAMGCIDDGDVESIGESLRPMIKIAPRQLRTAGIGKSINTRGEIVSVIEIERSEQLQKFHEKICDTVKSFFAWDVTGDMITGGRVGESTLDWIRHYFDKAAYDNFLPHITIGYGEMEDRIMPENFAVSQLAICHLGNHCTCAKILWSAGIVRNNAA